MAAGKKRFRRGVARLMAHIVLFAVLGAGLLGLGLTGEAMLRRDVENAVLPAQAAAIHDNVQTLLKDVMKSAAADAADQKAIDNGFNAKRKSVKTLLGEKIAEGPEAAADAAIDTYLAGVSAKLGEGDTLTAVCAAVEAARDDLKAQLTVIAEDASAGVSAASVRAGMSVTITENYALKYYGRVMVAAGAVCLAVSVLLLILYCVKNEEGRAALGLALEPLDYLLPFFVGVLIFTLYPMVRVFIMSFQEKYKLGKNASGEFVKWGLGNYRFVLFGLEGTTNVFLRALKNTALYVLLTVPITAVIAIIVAYLLNQKIRLNALFQTTYFIPMVTTATAVGLVWRWMFNERFGLINAVLNAFGFSSVNWLASGNHAVSMAVLVIYGVWSTLPFTIILLLSGLQNIDEHLYTVAKVDGSGPMRIFTRITVPLLSPTIGLVLIINSISAFKVYTDVVVLWKGAPEGYGMETVTWYITNNIALSDGTHSLGYAAAAAMVLFVIIFAFTMLQKWVQRKWVYQ